MRNPLENEETAFRFVLGTIAYLAPIVVASWIATWLGIVVFVLATGAALVLLRRGTRTPAAPPPPARRALVEDTRRILVIAGDTVAARRLHEVIVRLADAVAEDVLVVWPIGSGATPAASATERLQRALDALTRVGVNVRGEIVELDALAALTDALERFAPDEVVISNGAGGTSSPPAVDLVAAARERFGGPVTYVGADEVP